MTTLLIKQGFKRPAFLVNKALRGHPNLYYEKRESGYREALLKNNIPIDESIIIPVDYSAEGGIQGVRRLLELKDRPDAIVCGNDMIAMGALQELNRRGIRIPDEIAVCGFGDLDLAEFFVPSLTSVHFSYWEIGAEAMKLLDGISNNSVQSGRITYFRHTIIERDSTRRSTKKS
jgi:LacI family transcriptional regulator